MWTVAWTLVSVGVARGAPLGDVVYDPQTADAGRAARDDAADRVLGAPTDDAWALALEGFDASPMAAAGPVRLLLRPEVGLSLGDLTPDDNDGDVEPGLLTPRVGVGLLAVAGVFELRATPSVRAAVVPGATPELELYDLWGGLRARGWTVGFGRTARWLGPARRGPLVLSNNAVAPWLGSVAGEGRLPRPLAGLGRFRAELGLGLLGEPRQDVSDPGLLLVDLRYLPVPGVEIGATRAALFGGVGRPPVDVGQLLVPTEPHVYDDPDRTLADQDELAALDLRLCAPIRRWLPGVPVDHVEAYYQYGGEDVIARRVGAVPYPSLAGVANLVGGEVAAGPWLVGAEYSRLMDDTFRWYVGHRVYHEGFTQNGRSLGNSGSTDSELLWGRAAFVQPAWRVQASGESQRRVGVIESRNDKVFTLSTEERRWRAGVDLGVVTPARGALPEGWLTLAYGVGRGTGVDFVPGATALEQRGAVTWTLDLTVRGARPPSP